MSARTVSELRFGYAKFSQLTTYEDGGLPTTVSLGLKGFDKYNPTLPPMPRITFSGADAFTQLNYGGNENYGMAALIKVSKTYSLSETVTHSRGRHTQTRPAQKLPPLHRSPLPGTSIRSADD